MDTITVNKKDIIKALEKNKAKHIKAYEKAVKDYDKNARKQLKEFEKKLDKGMMGMRLNLTTPDNKSHRYTKLISMFNLELRDEIELTQHQFDEFIHDEFGWAISAYSNNTTVGTSFLSGGTSNRVVG